MLGCEDGNPLEADLLPLLANGVADRENAGVEDADDVAGVRLVDHLALRRHHLLRLGKAETLVPLHVIVFFRAVESARADAHESDTVAVRLVHVRLNLEDEGGKSVVERVDGHVLRTAGEGCRRHFQKMLEEGFHTEVVERGAEEDGR